MKTIRTAVASLLFVLAITVAAQDAIPPPASPDNLPPANIPDAIVDWILEVRTAGGLAGVGTGGFTISSVGIRTCILPRSCTGPMQMDALQSLSGLIRTLDFTPWLPRAAGNRSFQLPVRASVCSDCIVTTMLLRLHDSKLAEWTFQASWDATTQSTIPPEFKRTYEAATALSESGRRGN